MSDMGFGYYGTPEGEGAPNIPESGNQGPKWFRDKLEADSKVLAEMKQELDRLRAERRQDQVAKVFEAKGFNPGAAALYSGEPDKAEEWLEKNASFLVKAEDAPPAQPVQSGPPASTLSANSQAQFAAMNAAGTDGSAQTLTGDDAIAAALAATNSPEEFQQVAKSYGWNWQL